jgi:hypothetical protein
MHTKKHPIKKTFSLFDIRLEKNESRTTLALLFVLENTELLVVFFEYILKFNLEDNRK